MRLVLLVGVVVGSVLVAAWSVCAGGPQVASGREPLRQSTSGNGLIAMSIPVGDHRQQLTVIDPDLRVMSVYHVDGATGEIVLKSVRNIHWDLQMVDFNGTSPTPREIRTQLEQR